MADAITLPQAVCCAHAIEAAELLAKQTETTEILEADFPGKFTHQRHEEDDYPIIVKYVETRLKDLRQRRTYLSTMVDDLREQSILFDRYRTTPKTPLDLQRQTEVYNEQFAARVPYATLRKDTETLQAAINTFCDVTLAALDGALTTLAKVEGDEKTARRTKTRRRLFDTFKPQMDHLKNRVDACATTIFKRLDDERKAFVTVNWRIGYNGNPIGKLNAARLLSRYDTPKAIPSKKDESSDGGEAVVSSSEEEVAEEDAKEASGSDSSGSGEYLTPKSSSNSHSSTDEALLTTSSNKDQASPDIPLPTTSKPASTSSDDTGTSKVGKTPENRRRTSKAEKASVKKSHCRKQKKETMSFQGMWEMCMKCIRRRKEKKKTSIKSV